MKFRASNKQIKTSKSASKSLDQDEWWIVKEQKQQQQHQQHQQQHNPGATQLLERCIRHYRWDEQYARRVLLGYRQFLELKASMEDWKGDVLYPSAPVDQMWQQHVLDIGNYIKDCKLLFKKLVQYTPESGDLSNSERDRRIRTTQLALKARFGRSADKEIWDFNAVEPITFDRNFLETPGSPGVASVIPEVNSMLDFASESFGDVASNYSVSTNGSSMKALASPFNRSSSKLGGSVGSKKNIFAKNISRSFSFSSRKSKEQHQPDQCRQDETGCERASTARRQEQVASAIPVVRDASLRPDVATRNMNVSHPDSIVTKARSKSPPTSKFVPSSSIPQQQSILQQQAKLESSSSSSSQPLRHTSSSTYVGKIRTTPGIGKATTQGIELSKFNVGAFSVKVKSTAGDTTVIPLSSANCRVSDLKKAIHEKLGTDPADQRLIYAGRQLDDKFPLSSYGVKPQSTVSLIKSLARSCCS